MRRVTITRSIKTCGGTFYYMYKEVRNKHKGSQYYWSIDAVRLHTWSWEFAVIVWSWGFCQGVDWQTLNSVVFNPPHCILFVFNILIFTLNKPPFSPLTCPCVPRSFINPGECICGISYSSKKVQEVVWKNVQICTSSHLHRHNNNSTVLFSISTQLWDGFPSKPPISWPCSLPGCFYHHPPQ